jgi:hypothetical protein
VSAHYAHRETRKAEYEQRALYAVWLRHLQACEFEVGDSDVEIFVDDEVVRLQIAVRDPNFARVQVAGTAAVVRAVILCGVAERAKKEAAKPNYAHIGEIEAKAVGCSHPAALAIAAVP